MYVCAVCAYVIECDVGTVPVSDCVPVNECDMCIGTGVHGAVYRAMRTWLCDCVHS